MLEVDCWWNVQHQDECSGVNSTNLVSYLSIYCQIIWGPQIAIHIITIYMPDNKSSTVSVCKWSVIVFHFTGCSRIMGWDSLDKVNLQLDRSVRHKTGTVGRSSNV